MRKLTPKETAFLQQFIANKNYLQKRKITKRFIQFDRRKKKLEETLTLVPASDVRRSGLVKSLGEANQKALDGRFGDAYKDLNQVKKDARQAAREFAARQDPDSLRREIDRLDLDVSGLLRDLKRIADEMGRIHQALENEPKASECQTMLQAARRQEAFLSGNGADLQGRVADVQGLQQSVLANMPSPELPKQFLELGHAIEALAKTTRKPTADLTARLREVVEKSRREGKVLGAPALKEEFRRQREGFDQAFVAVTRMPPSKDLKPVMRDLAQKEQERLQKARMRFDQEFGGDVRVLQNTTDKPRAVEPLPQFDTAGFLNEIPGKFLDVPADELDQFCDKVETALMDEMADLEPNSDVLFDLTVKSAEDFAVEIGRSKGIYVDPRSEKEKIDFVPAPPNPDDLRDCTEAEKTHILTVAQRMAEAVAENHPNKTSAQTTAAQVTLPDRTTVQIDLPDAFDCNGTTYSNPRVLAAGGGGVAVRYEDPAGGYVVLKSLLPDKPRADMAQELRVHRHVMGGEEGEGHENVAGLKGVAVGPDGDLHMVMEYVEGGDVQKFSDSLQAAAQNGIISPQARDAVVQHVFLQALKGLQVAQARNATHHDIKPGNYLITDDGTVKLADFGSGKVADNPEGKVSSQVISLTQHLEAPEINRNDPETYKFLPVTGKADTYTLGVMLAHLTSETAAEEAKPQFASATDQRKYRSEQSGMALDRLKNAMLDPDPDKRPSLEAAALSAYSRAPDSVLNGTPEVAELLPALMAYTKELGSQGAGLQQEIMQAKGAILKLERSKEGMDATGVAKIDNEILAKQQEIDAAQRQLDQIHDRIRNDPRKKQVLENLERLDRVVRGYEPEEDETTKRWQESNQLLRQIHDLEEELQDPGTPARKASRLQRQLTALRDQHDELHAELVKLVGEEGEWDKDDETGEWAPRREGAAAKRQRRSRWCERQIQGLEARYKAAGSPASDNGEVLELMASLKERLEELQTPIDEEEEEEEEEGEQETTDKGKEKEDEEDDKQAGGRPRRRKLTAATRERLEQLYTLADDGEEEEEELKRSKGKEKVDV